MMIGEVGSKVSCDHWPGALGQGNCEVQGGVLDICPDGIWVWDDDFGIMRPMPGVVNVNVCMCVGGEGHGMAFLLFYSYNL